MPWSAGAGPAGRPVRLKAWSRLEPGAGDEGPTTVSTVPGRSTLVTSCKRAKSVSESWYIYNIFTISKGRSRLAAENKILREGVVDKQCTRVGLQINSALALQKKTKIENDDEIKRKDDARTSAMLPMKLLVAKVKLEPRDP